MDSIKDSIIRYLIGRGEVFGGVLEREIGRECAAKDSNVSRRCRELVNEGRLISSYEYVENGKGR